MAQRVEGNNRVEIGATRDSPLQSQADTDSGPALLALLDGLEAAAGLATALAGATGATPPLGDLVDRVEKLRAIAAGSDESAKRQSLSMLRSELEKAGPAPTTAPAHDELVQRVGDLALIGVAAAVVGLGFLAKRTYEYIRDRREDALLEQYYRTGVIANPAVPPELSAGIAALPHNVAKAARLFQNINNFRFRYTGRFVSPRMAFQAHQGDCQTLVGLYQEVAVAMGIPFAVGSLQRRQLVGPRPIHGRDVHGNTEGGTDWYFQEHFWATGAGTAYDVLFMTTPPPAAVLAQAPVVHNGVTYYPFPDGRCVIERGATSLGYDIQGEALVLPSAAAAVAFINAHP